MLHYPFVLDAYESIQRASYHKLRAKVFSDAGDGPESWAVSEMMRCKVVP